MSNFGEKLASVHSESSGMAYKCHKSCILAGHRSPLCIMHNIGLLMRMTGLVRVGKGRQHHMLIIQM